MKWLLVGVALACDARGWPASMERQPSVAAHEGPRPAPRGAVPEGGRESLRRAADAAALANPYEKDAPSAARGALLFATHCTACHGPRGEDPGKVAAKFTAPPRLRTEDVCARTDGYLYGLLAAGGTAMPPMREGLTRRDRWDLVSHIRKLQAAGCIPSEEEE